MSLTWTNPTAHIYAVGEIVTAATVNTYVQQDLAYLYGDTTWTAPTFTNGWADYGAGYVSSGFRALGTRIVFRGLIKSGTLATSAFTLPVGYRPPSSIFWGVQTAGGIGQIVIASSGTVTPSGGTNGFVALDSQSFDTI